MQWQSEFFVCVLDVIENRIYVTQLLLLSHSEFNLDYSRSEELACLLLTSKSNFAMFDNFDDTCNPQPNFL